MNEILSKEEFKALDSRARGGYWLPCFSADDEGNTYPSGKVRDEEAMWKDFGAVLYSHRALQAKVTGLNERVDKFNTYYVHQDLLLAEQEKVIELQAKVRELEQREANIMAVAHKAAQRITQLEQTIAQYELVNASKTQRIKELQEYIDLRIWEKDWGSIW